MQKSWQKPPEHRNGPDMLSWGQLSWDELEQPSTTAQELDWISSCHHVDKHWTEISPIREPSGGERPDIMVPGDIMDV